MSEGARFANATSKRAAAQTVFTTQGLWRQAVWGCGAAAALLLAVLAAFTDVGSQRAALLFAASNAAHTPSSQQPSQVSAQPMTQAPSRSLDPEFVVRQLSQTVRGLADDRDRMMKRLTAIERNVDDMTGSISQQIEAAKAVSTPLVVPWLSAASMAPIAVRETSPPTGWESALQPMPSAATQPSSDAPSPAGNAAYGAEIGNASSIKALHARWAGIRSAHLQILDGLTPVVTLRENPRSHKTELRLVVGPLVNAAAAAQLCATLMAVQLSCLPTMFDGRNLALE